MSDLIYHLEQDSPNNKNVLKIRLSASPPKAVASASEKSALEILFKSPLERGIYSIAPERSFTLLKLLGTTGRLFYCGKKVLIDPFSSFELLFQLESKEGGAALLSGQWKMGTYQGPLEGCDWFFPANPSWMLQDGIIRPLKEEVALKWLRKILAGPTLLDAKTTAEFLEEHAGESAVEWKNVAEAVPIDPFPYLSLHDRHGAFADLWFDYGPFGKIAAEDPSSPSWRKKEVEKGWEKDLLETDFIRKIVDRSHYFCPLDKVAKSLTFLMEIGWKIFDAKGRVVCRQTQESLSAELVKNRVHIRGEMHYEEHQVNLSQVMGAFNRREHFVEISPGAVALIDRTAFCAKWGDLAEEEIVSDGIAIPKKHFGLLSSFLEDSHAPLPDVLREKLRLLTRFAPACPVEVGKEFRAELFSYQNEGLQWLKFLEEGELGGLLADEMGLGKTVQVLAFFSQLQLSGPSLVVVPTSLLFHWKREVERFLPSLPLYLHAGKERVKESGELQSKGVILTSYALFRLDTSLFQQIDYQCIVLDEGQTIKNPDSQIAKALYPLKSQMRLIITGTPIENRHEDLWSLFHFLLPDLLGERKEFQAQVAAGQSDRRYLERIKKKISPFVVRRKKEQVALQLPPKLEQTVFVEMTEPQRLIYDQWMQNTQSGLLKKVSLEGASAHRMQILEAILRLRQQCAHPYLVGTEGPDPFSLSGKFERLFADLSEVVEEGSKVLVYSQFTQMLKLIEKEVRSRGWNHVYLDGGTQNREEVVRKFQEEKETQIFLVSLKAGGVGLNLTAADYVFLYDPWWNDAVEQQAIDRAHRVGKRSALIARRYITALSIEEKMMHLKSHKKALSQSLFEEMTDPETLSIDELLALLR